MEVMQLSGREGPELRESRSHGHREDNNAYLYHTKHTVTVIYFSFLAVLGGAGWWRQGGVVT